MNPIIPLLITGMAFTFLITLALVMILRRVIVHFIESRERDDENMGR